jgi:hypothetical protein
MPYGTANLPAQTIPPNSGRGYNKGELVPCVAQVSAKLFLFSFRLFTVRLEEEPRGLLRARVRDRGKPCHPATTLSANSC